MNSQNSPHQPKKDLIPEVCIVGAGITGLTLAYRLKKEGIPFVLVERSAQTGGLLSSQKENGFLFEYGPHTVLGSSAELLNLASEIGLTPLLSNQNANHRFIRLEPGNLVEVPTSPLKALFTPLIPLREKIHFLKGEFFKRPGLKEPQTETVASFFEKTVGPKTVENLIQPFISGTWAGDANELLADAAFKNLSSEYARSRSLLTTLKEKAKRKKEENRLQNFTPLKGLVSFEGGLQTLTNQLGELIHDSLWLNQKISRIEKKDSLFNLYTSNESPLLRAKKVILTTPIHTSLKLLGEPPLTPPFSFSSLAVVGFGVRNEDLGRELCGFGYLARLKKKDPSHFLGCLWPSSIFSDRAPKGATLLTVFLGGSDNPDERIQEAWREVAQDLKIKPGTAPIQTFYRFYQEALPQYDRLHFAKLRKIKTLEENLPGLQILGNYKDGVSLNDRVKQALQVPL